MHILEKYALDSASKIDKPFIFETFFPLPFQKYISFSPLNKNKQRYLYWSDVIDIINPYLEKEDIKIVQLNGDNLLNNCLNLNGRIDFKNEAYLIKHSLLHFGSDNLASQIASIFDKKIVTVYGDFPPENKKPYWAKEGKSFDITLKKDEKPNYNINDTNRINEIKPEEIATKILNLLNIKYEKMIRTEFIGRSYGNKTYEFIPNLSAFSEQRPERVANLIIRMDYFFDEKYLDILLNYKQSIIITNRRINLSLLEKNKKNILSIVYEIDEQNDADFVLDIKNIGIKYDLVSYLSEAELNKFKLKYLDLGLIHRKDPQEIPDNLLSKDKLYFFKSSKFLFSKEGLFNSKYHWANNMPIKDIPYFTKDIDPKEFENLYIFSIDK
jgi:hypothetical protein